MYKIAKLGIICAALFVLAGRVFADVPNLSAKMEQPKSPNNRNDLRLTVVTLDRLGRTMAVRCMKKAPSDGGFVQFGSTMTVAPDGGNSVTCNTSGSIFPSDGTYQFMATAEAGADSANSNTVSVDYDTTNPGNPTSYSKEKIDACSYKIRFKSADDAGQTVRVEVYRSENTGFDINSGTRVGTIPIGSNTEAEFTNTLPICDRTYFYAIRAFDAAGNGSGVVGDSEVHTTFTGGTTVTTPSAPAAGGQGAIPVSAAGSILGQSTGPTGLVSPSGEVKGETTPAPQQEVYQADQKGWLDAKKLAIGVGAVILLIVAWVLNKRGK